MAAVVRKRGWPCAECRRTCSERATRLRMEFSEPDPDLAWSHVRNSTTRNDVVGDVLARSMMDMQGTRDRSLRPCKPSRSCRDRHLCRTRRLTPYRTANYDRVQTAQGVFNEFRSLEDRTGLFPCSLGESVTHGSGLFCYVCARSEPP